MKNHARWTRLLQSALLLITVSGNLLHADEAGAPMVEQALLRGYLADPSTLTMIDARSAEEFAAGHLANAINLPLEQVDARMSQLPRDRDAPIVVYCVAGKRAAKVADALSVRGYRNVQVLPPAQLMYYGDVPVFNCATAAGESMSPLPASGQQAASACWQQQLDTVADAGEALWSSTALGTNGLTCAGCHPHATNIDPASFPRHMRQLGRVVELPEMINWCIRDTLKGEPLSVDDPAMIALRAYLVRAR